MTTTDARQILEKEVDALLARATHFEEYCMLMSAYSDLTGKVTTIDDLIRKAFLDVIPQADNVSLSYAAGFLNGTRFGRDYEKRHKAAE